jgi:transposase
MKKKHIRGGIVKLELIREVLRQSALGVSQRSIHRSTGIARSTLQEYLRLATIGGVDFELSKKLSDEELRVILKKQTPGRKRRGVVIEPEYEYLHKELHSRKGVTLELLWKEWVSATGGGYGYATFCRRYHEHCLKQQVVMRQEYNPGEKLLSDYAGVTLPWIDEQGVVHAAQIFVAVLGASNYIFTEASESQRLSCWINSHRRAFEYFGGVPVATYIDNLKSGVTKSHRYEPEVNRTFLEFAAHYGTTIFPVRVRKPRDKAKAEKAVQDVTRRILAVLRDKTFRSLSEINDAIRPLLEQLNARQMKGYGASRRELFERLEKDVLSPLPAQGYIYAQWKLARVSLDYHIQINLHYYSVPYYHARKEVWVKASEKLVEVFLNNERIAAHCRNDQPYRFSTLESHMPPNHRAVKSYTADKFLQWAKNTGPWSERLVKIILDSLRYKEQSYRTILGIQRYGEKAGAKLTEQAAEAACRQKQYSARAFKQILDAMTISAAAKTVAVETPISHANIRGAKYYH